MTDRELAGHIRAWAKRVSQVSGSARRGSYVYGAIKEVALGWGNWKNCVRGDPKKGWVAAKLGGVD